MSLGVSKGQQLGFKNNQLSIKFILYIRPQPIGGFMNKTLRLLPVLFLIYWGCEDSINKVEKELKGEDR